MLDTERRSVGIKSILRKLRGSAPRPVSPEDQIEGMYEKAPESELTGADEEDLAGTGQAKGRQTNLLLPKGRIP